MEDAGAQVIDLIFGRWRSQILYAGVKLGVFDALARGPKNAVSVASELDVDAGMLYRLMRALGSLELLHEDNYQDLLPDPDGRAAAQRPPAHPARHDPAGRRPGALRRLEAPAGADHRRAAGRLCPGVWPAPVSTIGPAPQLWGRVQ